jgi:hypothetical protein
LIRKCHVMFRSPDGKRAICIDKQNMAAIRAFIRQSDRYYKKWRHIVDLLLGGHKNPQLYDKEEINEKCRGVTAMKFFKGQENDRIYCKEQRTAEGLFIIVTAVVYERKKTQGVSKKEIPIIENIGQYEYEIEKL